MPLELPVRANQVWTMDFTQDHLCSGRKFRTLNLMDGYTREALAIEVDTSLPGLRVVRLLERLKQTRGVPEKIIVDNGPEFISRAVDQWAYRNGVRLLGRSHPPRIGAPLKVRQQRLGQSDDSRRVHARG